MGADGTQALPRPTATTLRQTFRERRLSLSTMEVPLRLATAAALATVVASALLVVFRDVGQPTIYLGRGLTAAQAIGPIPFSASLVLLSIGLAYLFTAAEIARPVVGLPALAVLLFGFGYYTGAFPFVPGAVPLASVLPTWARWTSRSLLIVLALGAVISMVAGRGREGRHELPRSHLALLTINACLFGGYWTSLAIASPASGQLTTFGPLVRVVVSSLSLAVYPLLQAASVDFGEWGQVGFTRLADALRLLRIGPAPVSAALCLGLVIYGYARASRSGVFSGASLANALRGIVVASVVWGLLLVMGWLVRVNSRQWPKTLGFVGVVTVCGVFTLGVVHLAGHLNGNFRVSPPPLTTRDGTYAPGADVVSRSGGQSGATFTLLLPRVWLAGTAQGIVAARSPDPVTRQLTVLSLSSRYDGADNESPVAAAMQFATENNLQVTGTEQKGVWGRAAFVDPATGNKGFVWLRVERGPPKAIYVIKEVAAGPETSEAVQIFGAIPDSFRTNGEPPATPPPDAREDPGLAHGDRLVAIELLIEIALSLAVLVAAVRYRARGSSRSIATALFFVMATVMELEINLPSVGRYLFGGRADWPIIGRYAIYVGIGVLGLGGLAAMTLRKRRADAVTSSLPARLIGLVGALVAFDVIYRLYSAALKVSRIAVWAALVLLVAVVWDVLMSGDSLTNLSSGRWPRSSRVFGFMGYVIVLCAAILFASAQTIIGTHGRAEPFLEPEAITQTALYSFALPLFVLLFYLGGSKAAAADQRLKSKTTGA